MAQDNTAENDHLLAEIEGAAARLIINRPQRRNAINVAMWRAIPGIIKQFEADPAVRVIIVRGAGEEAFSAGADISEFEETRATPTASRTYDQLNAAAFAAISSSPLPSIAMIHGVCFGGGFGLAAACDLRLASSEATFCIPAGKLGLAYPHESLAHITQIVGPALAKELIYTAQPVDAQAARAAGFLNRVLPAAELEDAVTAMCGQIADNAPLTLRAAKLAIDEATRHPGRPVLARIEEHANACFSSEDYAEGRRAFHDKRKPVFQGR